MPFPVSNLTCHEKKLFIYFDRKRVKVEWVMHLHLFVENTTFRFEKVFNFFLLLESIVTLLVIVQLSCSKRRICSNGVY
jgi:hypothetical protein